MEEKKNNKVLVGIIVALLIFILGFVLGYSYYKSRPSDIKKPNENKPVENNKYSKYNAEWSDKYGKGTVNIIKVENDMLTFTWELRGLGSFSEPATIPFKDDVGIFYYKAGKDCDDCDYTEPRYGKGIIMLSEGAVDVDNRIDDFVSIDISNVAQDEYENNISLDISDKADFFDKLNYNKYIYNQKYDKTSNENYSKYVGRNWSDEYNTEWFNIRSLDMGRIEFSWNILRIGGLDAELPFENGKVNFYYRVWNDQNYNGEEDEGEIYFKKGTIELKDDKVHIYLTDVLEEEYNSNESLIVTDDFGGSVYFDQTEYIYEERNFPEYAE